MLNTTDVGRHRQIRIICCKPLKFLRDRVNHKISIYCIHVDMQLDEGVDYLSLFFCIVPSGHLRQAPCCTDSVTVFLENV